MGFSGNLYVLEGPDGVGKTTLAKEVVNFYSSSKIPFTYMSFPGREPGTLGAHIYKLHHDPKSYEINSLGPASLQLLHISAHIDSIENRIIPTLKNGQNIILDRFWWSTWVYGYTSGIPRRFLKAMLRLEIEYWGRVMPSGVFLINRSLSSQQFENERGKLQIAYYELAEDQKRRYPVHMISNNSTITAGVLSITQIIENLKHITISTTNSNCSNSTQLGMDLLDTVGQKSDKVNRPIVFSQLSPLKPTPVFDTYWRFAAERQNIFFSKLRQSPQPWTTDPILSRYKFTNAYRASDRVSQYLIKNVIYHGEQSLEDIFFRTILFKLFNKIETWELLKQEFDPITYRDYSFERYDRILTQSLAKGNPIFSAAYIMPSGNSSYGYSKKHRNYLKLLEVMMSDELSSRVAEARSMLEVFELIRSYPMMGNFLAYQFTIDLNYSNLMNFSEMEFVVPGPGAKDGIRKCFSDFGGLNEADIIHLMTDRQELEFERLGVSFQSLFGRRLQLIDCQNLFCEVDKYARVAHPDIKGDNGRTRIKQKYNPRPNIIEYWYPPKWGINEKIGHFIAISTGRQDDRGL